ncbi:MAG: tRNA preQ1(34) S-adenosylmethionine ribosyltransferase-isomerase QueA, partial [Gammaproteobacteria bacterium]
MQLADFDYDLPESLIAQHPLPSRRAARLLVVPPGEGAPDDRGVAELPALLRAGDLVVLNDTRVIPARLHGHKDTGGAVEILVERVLDERRALAHVRASKSPRAGTHIDVGEGYRLEVLGRDDDLFELALVQPAGTTLDALLEARGEVPLPPYIERAPEAADRERYQTVFAAQPGAVAAPTAGLHLDAALLDEIRATGAAIGTLTLHVGAGTFRPVRGDDVEGHVMHAERYTVSAALCEAITAARAAGGRVVAIGTTVVRALESAAAAPGGLSPASGETRLFIRPGYRFEVIDALLTNFHLPRSTLLMLVSAFGGHARVMAAYRHAVAAGYRFFSYGDAMWH